MKKDNTPTPHISARCGDFAKTVLMPGDPRRATFIANNFLDNVRLVTEVRSIVGYTGEYKGKPVSVMASGMGMPSIGIYSSELFSCYDVENIIRVGSAGALQDNIKVRDIVLGMGACTDSNYGYQYNLPGLFAPTASYELLKTAADIADRLEYGYHVGNIVSSDVFYNADSTVNRRWASMGAMAVEMEAAALYMNAAYYGKRALGIMTISDHIMTGESLSSDEREQSFTQMMTLSLELALSI